MTDRVSRIIDMTPQGEFVAPPGATGDVPRARPLWVLRLGLGAAVVAAVAGGLALAAVFLWLATLLIPVAIVAGAVAYIAFRFQLWRARR